MKKIVYLVGFILVGFGVYSIAFGNRIETKIFAVKGMHCNDCLEEVEEALLKIDGVTNVTVSLEKGEATVSYKNRRVSPEVLQTKITSVEKKMEEDQKEESCGDGTVEGCCGTDKADVKKI